MNDTWGWALAWAEQVPDSEIKTVAKLYKCWGWAGLLYWTSEQNNQMKSEFFDNNRMIEFVRKEEKLKKDIPNSSERAYLDTNKKSIWNKIKEYYNE